MSLVKTVNLQVYKDSDSIVVVSNVPYKTFKGFTVSRSIDDICGQFNISLSRPPKSQSPFRLGDIIDIQLDGVQIMRAKIYEVSPEGDASTDEIYIAGRDITGDLIDSTVPDEAKVYDEGVNIFSIAETVIRALGLNKFINIINQSGAAIEPFKEDEIASCKTGLKAIMFLQWYCRKRQLFLNTDNNGNLIFFKANGVKTGNRLINEFENNQNNVVSYKAKYNSSDRFYKYICKSQDANSWSDNEIDAQGIALDTEIATTRVLEFKLEEEGDSAECVARAKEEANVRNARSFEYIVTVQGFKDKVLWDVNQFVNISDDKTGIKGEFLVKKVEYTLNNVRGRMTKLTITNRDAYTAQAAVDQRTERKRQLSESGSGWIK